MKSIFKFFFIAVLFTTLMPLSSCKKGANDPTLSLRSRSSRLAGAWSLSSSDYTVVKATASTKTTITDHYTFDGTKYTMVSTEVIGNSKPIVDTFKYTYSELLTIDKANTFTRVTTFNYGPPFTAQTSTESGNWSWLNKDKDAELKKKEAVVFMSEKFVQGTGTGSTSTNGKTDNPVVILIDELRNSKLVILNNSTSNDGGGTIYTTTGSMTYVQ